MFSDILGIPAHPLYVHAAVVFVALLALFAVVYAFVPRWRAKTDWATAGLAVLAPLAALAAKLSGDKFIAARYPTQRPPNVLHHRSFGTSTFWWTLALAVAVGLLFWVLRRGSAGPAWLRPVTQVVVLVLAVITAYYVVRTGDSGAESVWGRT
ncbi:MAG: hypothetical protein HOU81_22025 [Hamadaea sp.]|uniref:DUF2231 domain-containing protein n=1 Tax=Hamadaea sp. TaxID=2024425 RepID=UPI00179D50FE|nr:DUF2231 domain-containing protein [Hamadaea sp.]NUR73506.1 hypothetical protein [Hamadaea sp.]NUT21673.1 hypothetical protein [Hamadaea sp.]